MKRNKLIRLLGLIATATAVAPGYAVILEKDAKELAAADVTMAEINTTIPNLAAGHVAIRATPAGIAALQADPASVAAANPQTPAPGAAVAQATPSPFKLEDGVALPAIARGGSNSKQYPFDQMAVNQSFFVAGTEAKPNPAKSLASTVSSATKRFKGQTPERKFTVRAVTENGVKGARVWRTA